jgi:hypothetical protein
VQNRTPLLHSPIVAPADDATSVHENGTNRNPAFPPSLLGFIDGGVQKGSSRLSHS